MKGVTYYLRSLKVGVHTQELYSTEQVRKALYKLRVHEGEAIFQAFGECQKPLIVRIPHDQFEQVFDFYYSLNKEQEELIKNQTIALNKQIETMAKLENQVKTLQKISFNQEQEIRRGKRKNVVFFVLTVLAFTLLFILK